jgi:hypothetical protein
VSVGLRAPMTEELAWANVMRPRIPLVYLDLNSIIYMARSLRGDTNVPAGYTELHDAVLRAKSEKRAMFPLGEAHLWEIAKITDRSNAATWPTSWRPCLNITTCWAASRLRRWSSRPG